MMVLCSIAGPMVELCLGSSEDIGYEVWGLFLSSF